MSINKGSKKITDRLEIAREIGTTAKKQSAGKKTARIVKIGRKGAKTQKTSLKHTSVTLFNFSQVSPTGFIEKLHCVSEDLYRRDIVETNHTVNSGTSSIKELRKKYDKYIK